MTVTLIAAVAENGLIGHANKIPWSCPEDMLFFKGATMGHSIIMGRKTWESLGCKTLPGRHNIVISSTSPEGLVSDVSWATDLKSALRMSGDDPFIIGGAKIYSAALEDNVVDRMLITRIHASPVGDTYFPPSNYYDHMRCIWSDKRIASVSGRPDFTFEEWVRI